MAQQDSVRFEAITQEGRSERPSDRSRRVAEARAKFRAIRLPTLGRTNWSRPSTSSD